MGKRMAMPRQQVRGAGASVDASAPSASPLPSSGSPSSGRSPEPVRPPIGLAAPAIRLRDLTVAFERQPAVHHLSGSFATGSLTAIVGPNGAGKSTLLRAIVGLVRPAEGTIERSAPGAIAFLPQQAEIDRSFPISVLDTVLMGLWRRIGWGGGVDAAMRRAATVAIAIVGLSGLERRSIGSLSVGQLQRALFARIILEDAPIILLDE